jgi:hypothetical protein
MMQQKVGLAAPIAAQPSDWDAACAPIPGAEVLAVS